MQLQPVWRVLALCLVLAPSLARGQGTYWTAAAVLKDMFAQSERVTFVKVPADSALTRALGYAPPKTEYTVFVARTGEHIDGYAVVDEERGQHLPIQFAIQLDPTGRVQRSEVMRYAEAYGEEIREARFRAQFAGKTAEAPMRLGDDVVAISGATISARSMTVAVKRAMVLVQRLVHPPS